MRAAAGSEEAVPLTMRGAGELVRARVFGLTPRPRTGRPIVVVLASDSNPTDGNPTDGNATDRAETLCRRLAAAGRVAVLYRCPTGAVEQASTVVEWIADRGAPLGGRRGEVQLGAVGAAVPTARQVTARIDRARWPTVIRPLVTEEPNHDQGDLTIMNKPPVVDHETWRKELDELRVREKAATRELDAIAARRRRLPMVKLPEYTLVGAEGPVRLVDVFDGRTQLITYHHMWSPNSEWQCGGCTSFTSSFTRLDFLDNYDARFVVITPGPIDEGLAYAERVGNTMTWYSTADSSFGADVDAPLGAGFGLNVFLRDGDTVYRTWHTNGRGVEQLTYTFALADVLPYGRREQWLDSPDGWPTEPTYSNWLDSPDIARLYGGGPA